MNEESCRDVAYMFGGISFSVPGCIALLVLFRMIAMASRNADDDGNGEEPTDGAHPLKRSGTAPSESNKQVHRRAGPTH
jgi:hypothetical protein